VPGLKGRYAAEERQFMGDSPRNDQEGESMTSKIHAGHNTGSSHFSMAIRRLPALAAGLACCAGVALDAAAQAFPTKPVRVFIPYRSGGMSEAGPRLYSEKMSALLGQPFVVEFKPGANGLIAINETLNAAPDGHTLLASDSSHWAILPAMQTVPYDFLRDFAPVTSLYENSLIYVAPVGEPFNSFKEFVALAKSKPGALNYASPGIGTVHQLMTESIKAQLKLDVRHIPFNGGGEVVAALLRGDVNIAAGSGAVVLPMVKAGKLKMLGVTRGKRTEWMKEVPTIAEQTGLDFDVGGVQGFVTKAGTPRAFIDRLSQIATQVGREPEFKARIQEIGSSSTSAGTPEAFAAVIRNEIKIYGEAVKMSGAKAQ